MPKYGNGLWDKYESVRQNIRYSLKYTSSNPDVIAFASYKYDDVAKVLSDGRVKTKKTGTATISCKAENGKTYKKTIKVEKAGLNYTKLTSYYFTGFPRDIIHISRW